MPPTPTSVPKVPVVNVRVSPGLYARVIGEADRRQCSVSDVVREALVEHLDGRRPPAAVAIPA